MLRKIIQIIGLSLIICSNLHAQLVLQKTISGGITPKSIVHNHNGLFFAQNMIYMHNVTVYDENYELVKKINDRVNLEQYGYSGGSVKGGPVEVAFSHNGAYAWVSNYTMEGSSYTNPGCDNCSGTSFDKGFLYKINTRNFKIEQIVEVGSVPKYVAVSPDNRYVLVSNWTSGDVSVVDAETGQFIKSIYAGRHPRGIVVDPISNYAYVTIMGSDKIMKLNLENWEKTWIEKVGKAPRHVCIDPNNRYLYCSINNLGKLIKIDLSTHHIVGSVYTGSAPRSMEITPDGQHLFVVNYSSNSISKVATKTMKELTEVETKLRPIGITLNWSKQEIWVACYSGYIQIFKDTSAQSPDMPGIELLAGLSENSNSIMAMLPDPDPKTSSPPEKTDQPDPDKNDAVIETEVLENNFLPNVYIVVGSFSNSANASRFKKKLIGQGYEAVEMPSQVQGFTYTAIKVKSNPTGELTQVKQSVISSAWIYRP